MLTGQLTIPPLFHINREEIINPAKQIEQVVQKQQIEYREVELNPPNQTLYVNRLNEKVQVDDMRVSLYALFSNVGKVIDVVVKKNILMRGQAFVLMESIEQAKEAQERYHNYTLYEKPMVRRGDILESELRQDEVRFLHEAGWHIRREGEATDERSNQGAQKEDSREADKGNDEQQNATGSSNNFYAPARPAISSDALKAEGKIESLRSKLVINLIRCCLLKACSWWTSLI